MYVQCGTLPQKSGQAIAAFNDWRLTTNPQRCIPTPVILHRAARRPETRTSDSPPPTAAALKDNLPAARTLSNGDHAGPCFVRVLVFPEVPEAIQPTPTCHPPMIRPTYPPPQCRLSFKPSPSHRPCCNCVLLIRMVLPMMEPYPVDPSTIPETMRASISLTMEEAFRLSSRFPEHLPWMSSKLHLLAM